MSLSSLFVIVPGFGCPNMIHKCQILESNLEILGGLKDMGLFRSVYITVCIYDECPETVCEVVKILYTAQKNTQGFIQGIYKVHPGIVGQFILKHAHPDIIDALTNHTATYTMILLDDVELKTDIWTSSRWKDVFYDIRFHRLDVFSPSLTDDSKCLFPYMRQRTGFGMGVDVLSMTPACELFCYILPQASYKRYYQELEQNDQHPWLWGIDLVLHKHIHFRVGLSHYISMRHHYQSTPDTSERSISAFKAMGDYLNQYGETQESLATQPAILQDIYVYHRLV
jgi:hypothetical protein